MAVTAILKNLTCIVFVYFFELFLWSHPTQTRCAVMGCDYSRVVQSVVTLCCCLEVRSGTILHVWSTTLSESRIYRFEDCRATRRGGWISLSTTTNKRLNCVSTLRPCYLVTHGWFMVVERTAFGMLLVAASTGSTCFIADTSLPAKGPLRDTACNGCCCWRQLIGSMMMRVAAGSFNR